jgi:four helix bundle protein
MAPTVSPRSAGAATLACERLDVYRVALEFQALATTILRSRGLGSLRDQLDRASTSILMNISEGAGRLSNADERSFDVIARGSAMECLAILDVLELRGQLTMEAHRHGRDKLARIVRMLSRLVTRFSRT